MNENDQMQNGYVNLITRPLQTNFEQYPIIVKEKILTLPIFFPHSLVTTLHLPYEDFLPHFPVISH